MLHPSAAHHPKAEFHYWTEPAKAVCMQSILQHKYFFSNIKPSLSSHLSINFFSVQFDFMIMAFNHACCLFLCSYLLSIWEVNFFYFLEEAPFKNCFLKINASALSFIPQLTWLQGWKSCCCCIFLYLVQKQKVNDVPSFSNYDWNVAAFYSLLKYYNEHICLNTFIWKVFDISVEHTSNLEISLHSFL